MSAQGWYADPAGDERLRWWDGAGWTRWRSTDENAPPPATAAETPTEPGVRLSAAVGIVVATLLLAMITAGAVVAASTNRAPRITPLEPPTVRSGRPTLDWDPTSRLAAVQELHFTAPPAPFSCLAAPVAVTGLFSQVMNCDVDVHTDYNAKGDDWTASTGLGVLDSSALVEGTMEQTADRVLDGVLDAFYANTKLTVTKRVRSQLNIAPAGRAVLLRCDAAYKVAGLASHSDRVVIALVRLESGQYGAWYVALPNDVPEKDRALLTTSANSLTAQR